MLQESFEDVIVDASVHFNVSLRLKMPAAAPDTESLLTVQLSVSSDRQHHKAVTRFFASDCTAAVCSSLPLPSATSLCDSNAGSTECTAAASSADSDLRTVALDALDQVPFEAGSAVPRSAATSASASSARDSVSVMAVNIWNYNHWPQRVPLFHALFDRLKPGMCESALSTVSHSSLPLWLHSFLPFLLLCLGLIW